MMACETNATFITRWATSSTNRYQEVRGSLQECYTQCASGAWPGCVGFSRYMAAGEDVNDKCWWTADASSFMETDSNKNEHLYIYQPPSSGAFRCAPKRGASAFTRVPDAGMTLGKPYYTAFGMTLSECQEFCSSGAWVGCVGFSRDISDPDDSRGKCYWTTQIGWPFTWNDADSDENLWVLNVPPARCVDSCEECETLTGLSYCTLPSPPPPPSEPPSLPPSPAPPGYCANTCNQLVAGAEVGRCDDGVETGGHGLCAPGRCAAPVVGGK